MIYSIGILLVALHCWNGLVLLLRLHYFLFLTLVMPLIVGGELLIILIT